MAYEPLIKHHPDIDPNSLCDWLLLLAYEVEDAMTSAGAIPGQDYGYRDLFLVAATLMDRGPEPKRRATIHPSNNQNAGS